MEAASGPGGVARRRSRGGPSEQEARTENQAGLGDHGSECHAEPSRLGGFGGAPEGCKGGPDAGHRVRVVEQLVQVG